MATTSGSDDAHLYLGIGQTRGHIMVCPSLQEWIGEELRKENLVLKERCKAREERLPKPAPPGKKH